MMDSTYSKQERLELLENLPIPPTICNEEILDRALTLVISHMVTRSADRLGRSAPTIGFLSACREEWIKAAQLSIHTEEQVKLNKLMREDK